MRRTRFTRAAGLTLVAVAAVATAGCGGTAQPETTADNAKPADIQSAAEGEGSLVVYSGFPEAMQAELDTAFSEEYGIDVSTERLIQDTFAQRVTAEIESQQYVADVVLGSNALVLDEWRDEGWLTEIDPASLPELKAWPADSWSGYWADVQPFIYGIAYNSDLIPAGEAPKTWSDVVDAPWAQDTLLVDPATGTTSIVPYQFLSEVAGTDYLSEIAAGADFIESTTPGLQSVGAGSASAILPVASPVYVTQKNSGLPLEIVYPDPTLLTSYRGAALESAPHPNAAVLYLNFLLSEKAQSIINADGFSLRDGVPGTEPVPNSAEQVDWNEAVENRDAIIDALKR